MYNSAYIMLYVEYNIGIPNTKKSTTFLSYTFYMRVLNYIIINLTTKLYYIIYTYYTYFIGYMYDTYIEQPRVRGG